MEYNTQITPHSLHIHDNMRTQNKSRDFHKIAIELYENIPDDEKKYHTKSINHYIEKWHYQPHEAWGCEDGVWKLMEYYLATNFSDLEKYSKLVEIFNKKE